MIPFELLRWLASRFFQFTAFSDHSCCCHSCQCYSTSPPNSSPSHHSSKVIITLQPNLISTTIVTKTFHEFFAGQEEGQVALLGWEDGRYAGAQRWQSYRLSRLVTLNCPGLSHIELFRLVTFKSKSILNVSQQLRERCKKKKLKKNLTSVSFAFTHTYTDVKTNSFRFFPKRK